MGWVKPGLAGGGAPGNCPKASAAGALPFIGLWEAAARRDAVGPPAGPSRKGVPPRRTEHPKAPAAEPLRAEGPARTKPSTVTPARDHGRFKDGLSRCRLRTKSH
ncbi:hypothetical protein Srufu_042950 [Streptomyces libani subsp. rufus]|nr:hypothetical protein Srufu_042950 [Streptomyces libani subsp. rufus]